MVVLVIAWAYLIRTLVWLDRIKVELSRLNYLMSEQLRDNNIKPWHSTVELGKKNNRNFGCFFIAHMSPDTDNFFK